MGLPTQSLALHSVSRGLGRRGLALPTAMFALVALSVLVAGVYTFADLSAKAVRNRESATRAMHLAESGLAHALKVARDSLKSKSLSQILRGSDGVKNTADDGLLTGYGWTTALQIPSTGKGTTGGSYFVRILDDPAEVDGDSLTDVNTRLLINCRGVTLDGASSEVNVIVSNLVLPGVAVGGNLEISGKLKVQGACGTMHTNGNITGGGEPTVTVNASATGTVGPGTLSPQLENQPVMAIPDLYPADYWSSCDFYYTGNWTLNSSKAPGTYCITGNVTSSGDFGSMANMKAISVIATGYIKISSKPFIKADHPDGILFVAGGDFDFQGDWGAQGLLYSRGQCYVSSKPVIIGQLVCKSTPGAPGPVSNNQISGDAVITYGCGGPFDSVFRINSWYPSIRT